ncbi:MAG TPA: 50S ribosomal protein L5 [Candidatus Hydrogenedentes bacterium]|nr:50S ribosomal protein L5 [Candidatus Hydrogenedentota bacterium]
MAARLRDKYKSAIAAEMRQQFGYKNVMEIPHLEKIVINMGVGDGPADPRLLEGATSELSAIAGQKPSIRTARKSISNFKLREGAKIGCMVTLRGDRMYEFMDRLFNVAIPRVRDFRGISPTGFDKQGNYTLGLREQTIFPEIKVDAVAKVRGMNVTFVIKNARSADESRELLRKFGAPFRA